MLAESTAFQDSLSKILTQQFIGLVMSTFLTAILIISLYYGVIKKQTAGKAPTNKIMMLLEIYYTGFSNLLNNVMDGKNKWAQPYLFTLFNFILINSLIPWLGFEAAPSTLMFTFPLTLITFITIYVIGIGTKGLWGFCKHKYSNPLEIVLQFAPLLSMSVRLFAATLAGAIIGNVVWVIVGGIIGTGGTGTGLIVYIFPGIQGTWHWAWALVDSALSLLQSFVFIMLTAIFWTMETGQTWSRKERKRLKLEKKELAIKELNDSKEKELKRQKVKMASSTSKIEDNKYIDTKEVKYDRGK